MNIKIKDIEIEISLAELLALPPAVRWGALKQIAGDEDAKPAIETSASAVMEQRKEKKSYNVSPENRAKSAERMRKWQAEKKAKREAEAAEQAAQAAQDEIDLQDDLRKLAKELEND